MVGDFVTGAHTTTYMYQEAAEASGSVAQQGHVAADEIARIGEAFRREKPALVLTIARGSSDHAATYIKYLIEKTAGIPVGSYAPSLSSIYGTEQKLVNTFCIAISQSGRSPDIIAAAVSAKRAGARIIALVNEAESPLADCADFVAKLCADPEKSVAATKSYIASLAMAARIVADWQQDPRLANELDNLPHALEAAWELTWPDYEPPSSSSSLLVLGRGIGLTIAAEAALKFKETCRLHAEAYSAAEVLHGPAAIVRSRFPVFAFAQNDATLPTTLETLTQLKDMGADILVSGANMIGARHLPTIETIPELQPLTQAQSFYRFVNDLAIRCGFNPDSPSHLKKVTMTV